VRAKQIKLRGPHSKILREEEKPSLSKGNHSKSFAKRRPGIEGVVWVWRRGAVSRVPRWVAKRTAQEKKKKNRAVKEPEKPDGSSQGS